MSGEGVTSEGAGQEAPLEAEAERQEEKQPAPPSRFYIVNVVSGMEVKVAAVIMERARSLGLDIRSVIVPYGLKGYVIIEAGDPGDAYEVVRRLRHVKSTRPKLMNVSVDEIIKMVKPEEAKLFKIEEGQEVEVIYGPLRGLRGKVLYVDERKGEVMIAIQDAAFRGGSAMTMTVPIEHVRPLKEGQP